MKYSSISTLALALCANKAMGFPALMKNIATYLSVRDTTGGSPQYSPDPLASVLGFDASKQYVSNTGQYEFVAPGPNDQRGPCPGSNAMANHGYLPHNGVATIPEIISGTYEVFGTGGDLSTFLGIYGAVFDGDLTSYSIGSPDPNLVSNLGLLGEPMGLNGSHNKYEGDVSPIRGDLYQYGNDYKVQLKQFTELYELGMENDDYDLEVLTSYRATRFPESVSNNPHFFNAPFSGVVASPAAWSFIYRFMANKSEQYPQWQLNGEVLKSFYAITGDYPNFVYNEGQEKIPDNWYTRARGDEYTIPFLSTDTPAMAVAHPEFLSLGGNTGIANSFASIDPSNLTDAAYNSGNLLQGNNALCYGLELTTQETPDILSGLFTDTNAATDMIGSALSTATNSLGCPQLNSINKDQFSAALAQYPRYTKLNSDGSY